jgi:hypothetical protein
MKTWQTRHWMSTFCCGLDGAIQVETDCDNPYVEDGDRARCKFHGCAGVVRETCGHMVIDWEGEE